MRHPNDLEYRQQGLKNAMNASAAMNKSARENGYLQETLKRAKAAEARLNAALRDLAAENQRRISANEAASRAQDAEVVRAMRELIADVALKRDLQRFERVKDLPDELAEIMLPRAEINRLRSIKNNNTTNRKEIGNIGDRMVSAASFVTEKASSIQRSIDINTSYEKGPYSTNFGEAANSFVEQYIEDFLEQQLAKLVRDGVVDLEKGLRKAVATGHALLRLVDVAGKLPAPVTEVISFVIHPTKGAVEAVVNHVLPHPVVQAATNVSTGIVIPMTKLIQPLTSVATILLRQPKIDAMHALHQRRSTCKCCDVAYQIAGKWEDALVQNAAGGNAVYSFITAFMDIYNAVGKLRGKVKAASPGEALWLAAQNDSSSDHSNCDNALLILATLFGRGDASKGIVKAVAAIVKDRKSGIQEISSFI